MRFINKVLSFVLMVAILLGLINENAWGTGFPYVGAESFIVIESKTGKVIASKNPQEKQYMASTTKIMTGILAIEKLKDLDKTVTIPAECTNIEGSSMYLVPNQKVKLIDLLYGLMLRSGNDAATALAYFAGNKSCEEFIEEMNKKAVEIGAFNTHFTNPHGLHNKEHYTTAYDLALISKYAMENPVFKEIVGTKKYVNSDNKVYITNKNKVVYQYKYGNGIKIGYTKTAGRCLVASANKEDFEVIVVLLGDGNWFNDSYRVFDFVYDNYRFEDIIKKGQIVSHDEDGEPVFAKEGFRYPLINSEKEKIRIECVKTIPHIVSDERFQIFGVYKVYLGKDMLQIGELYKLD